MAEWDQRAARNHRHKFVLEVQVEWGWKIVFEEQPRGQPVCLLPTASGEKKEGWSWESYLEEQEAITAPVSLFQDVSHILSS